MAITADFTLRQMEYFVAIARTGSIKEAASAVGASPSAVSLAIKQLEQSLEAQLFVRQHAKGVTLTPTGQRILADSRTILMSAESVASQARESEDSLKGLVRIGCFAPFMPFVAPIIYDDLARLYPDIDAHIEVASVAALRVGILSGELDFAVLSDRGVTRGIGSRPVLPLRPHVILSSDNPLAGKTSIHLAELADEPLITLDLSTTEEQLERIVRSAGVVPRVARTVPDLETVRSLVARGLGYSIQLLPIPTAMSYEGRGMVRIPIADDVPESQIVIASADGVIPARRVAVIANRFASTIQKRVAEGANP